MFKKLRTQMKVIMIIVVVAFLLSTLLMYEGRSRRTPRVNADGTMSDYEVAQVNGRAVMRSELENRLRQYAANSNQRDITSRDMPRLYQTVLDQYTLFLNDNKFWYSAGKTKMKAFRAYFDFLDILTDVEDNYASRNITMSFNNNTTGISTMHNSECIMHNSIYDLQGRRVVKPGKGLYIKNGRKEVVR